MKKNIIIIVLFAAFMCSCNERYSIAESIPDIEGSWKWHSSIVGGVIGIYPAEIYNPDCYLIFEKDNLLSIKDGEEYIIYQEEFIVTKPKNIPLTPSGTPAGEYMIKLPKDINKAIENYFANHNHDIYVDGYVSISIENNNTMLNIIKEPNVESVNYIGSHYTRQNPKHH